MLWLRYCRKFRKVWLNVCFGRNLRGFSSSLGALLPRECLTFHRYIEGEGRKRERTNKLIFFSQTHYGQIASRRLALSFAQCWTSWTRCCFDIWMGFSRRASRVSIKICDGKYRNNESARQQIDVSKLMRAPAIFALFLHFFFFYFFFATKAHCLDHVQVWRRLKWIFAVYSRFVSRATAIKRNSDRSSIAFVNSALHTFAYHYRAQHNEGHWLNVPCEPIKSHQYI